MTSNLKLKDYVPLPLIYFNYTGIKPPLVEKSWLNQISVRIRNERKAVQRKRGRPKKEKSVLTSSPINENLEIFNECNEGINEQDLEITEEIEIEDKLSPHNADDNTLDTNNAAIDLVPEPSTQLETAKNNKMRPKGLTVEPITIDSRLVYVCPDCGKSFRALSTLRYHYKHHTGDLLQCETCGSSFARQYQLKCHQRIHTGELFTCSICDKGFTTAELLKVHRRGHTGDKPFACLKCDKKFSSASNLAQHKEIHQTLKKYLCTLCGASFMQRRCLDGHMVIHGEKNHICSVCGKAWARKSDLVEHARTHTGDRPFECTICHNKFTQASSLKRHAVTHRDTCPWACEFCSRSFRSKTYYKRHVRMHQTNSLVGQSGA